MTCLTSTSSDFSSGSGARSVQGLCLAHAREFAAVCAAQQGVDTEEICGVTYRTTRHVGGIDASKYASLLELQPRCDGCPTFIGDALWDVPQYANRHTKHLGEPCRISAMTAANIEFPDRMPSLGYNSDPEPFWITAQADQLIQSAWAAFIRSWPSCPGCPIPAPPKPKDSDKLEVAVLDALAMHGTVGRSDLLALGIKGLKGSNFGSVMAGLVARGAVTCTPKGPAKFYALAA